MSTAQAQLNASHGKHWLAAIRPKTLTIALVPVLVGTTLAWAVLGTFDWVVMAAALAASAFIQVGTNMHNDVADCRRGADKPESRLGPPRVTAEGWLSAAQVERGVAGAFGAALLLGLYLVWIGGWPVLVIGLLSIAAGLAYSGGSVPIAYTSLGELFVWVFFGLVAVAGSYYLQVQDLNWLAVGAGAIVGMPAAGVLVVNNYRDLDHDRAVGRRTFAVQFGRRASQLEYALLMLAPFPALLALFPANYMFNDGWLILPWLALPWALVLVRRFRTETPGPLFNELLAGTARFQLVFGLLFCLGVVCGGSGALNPPT
jgi:1,4-dihydroxy-2-naphthoate octaprenyltransferase